MKICFLFLILILSGCTAQSADDDKKVDAAASNAFSTVQFLGSEKDPGKKADLTFDFGTRELMSDELYRETVSVPGKPEPETFNDEAGAGLQGIKKIFRLVNNSDRPIVINEFDADCACLSLGIWNGEISVPFPYTVPPNKSIEVIAVFSPYIVAPGYIASSATLVGGEKNSTLAVIRVRGKLNSGFKFFPTRVKLRREGKNLSALFRLKIDRHFQSKMPSDALKLTSSNRNFIISSVPNKYKTMGITVHRDTIRLVQALGDDLPRDLDLTFQVTLAESAPIGKNFSKIELNVPGLPAYMSVQGVEMWVEAEKVGSMKLKTEATLPFGNVKAGKIAKVQTRVVYPSTFSSKIFKATSSNKYFKPTLIFSSHGINKRKVRGLMESEARLVISLAPQTPHGYHIAKIMLRNMLNQERIEVMTFATVH